MLMLATASVQVVVPADSCLEGALAEADYFGLVDLVGELARRLEEQQRGEVGRQKREVVKKISDESKKRRECHSRSG